MTSTLYGLRLLIVSIRNDLLDRIAQAYGASAADLSRNHYLVNIIIELGDTPRNENNRNMLLEDILNLLTGGFVNTDWAQNGDWADNGDWA